MTVIMDPNFPKDLAILPNRISGTKIYDSDTQAQSIQKYGIAGRVWEAAYPLVVYLLSPLLAPGLEFDPPSSLYQHPPVSVDNHDNAISSLAAEHTKVRAIELGSGTGIVAAELSSYLHEDDMLIATDLPSVCPLLEENLKAAGPRVLTRPLAWGAFEHAHAICEELKSEPSSSHLFTHILCSDLVYFPDLLAPLLRTLLHLTTASPTSTVLISYKIRSLTKESPFWAAFGLWFEFLPVLCRRNRPPKEVDQESGSNKDSGSSPWKWFPPLGNGMSAYGGWNGSRGRESPHFPDNSLASEEDRIFIFYAHRRLESLTWIVPEKDSDLLRGVGACGSPYPKGDDTFELLMLMGMDADEDDCLGDVDGDKNEESLLKPQA